MPRSKRYCPGGMVFHCLNRSVGLVKLFEKDEDYEAFEQVLWEAWERVGIRILAYVATPADWEFVVWLSMGASKPATEGRFKTSQLCPCRVM